MSDAIRPSLDLNHLSIDDRALLAHALWNSVEQEATAYALTPEQKMVLDQRLAQIDSDNVALLSWDEVRNKLLQLA